MTRFGRALACSIFLFLPVAVNAAMWEFAGGLNIEQSVAADGAGCSGPPSVCTVVPDPYFGGGFVVATLDDVSGLFTWEYGFGGLSGPATNAHFHEAPAGSGGGVALGVAFGGTSGTFSGSTTLVDTVMNPALTNAITALTGDGTFVAGDITNWYLNIHTGLNPVGELRGQLFVDSVVPIPAGIWLMISAPGALVGARRFT